MCECMWLYFGYLTSASFCPAMVDITLSDDKSALLPSNIRMTSSLEYSCISVNQFYNITIYIYIPCVYLYTSQIHNEPAYSTVKGDRYRKGYSNMM